MTGLKFDKDKLRWDLVPFIALIEMVKVLTAGAQKYGDDNWKYVKHAKHRYFAALMRHLSAWWIGEREDSETKLHHLAHAGCCVLFLLYYELMGYNEEKGETNDLS